MAFYLVGISFASTFYTKSSISGIELFSGGLKCGSAWCGVRLFTVVPW